VSEGREDAERYLGRKEGQEERKEGRKGKERKGKEVRDDDLVFYCSYSAYDISLALPLPCDDCFCESASESLEVRDETHRGEL
jgi:hypothetical protein